MHVAMIGQKGMPAHSGGVERYVEELCRRLASHGVKTTVYSRRWYHRLAPHCPLPNLVRNIITPSIPTKHLDTITHVLYATVDAITRRDIDIVHVHCLGPALVLPLLKLARKPIIVTVHGLDWRREKWGRLAKTVLRCGEFLAARLADRVTVVSPALVEYFADKYGCAPVCIPNAASALPYRPPRRIFELGLKPLQYLLTVGRLVPEKGFHYAIQAYEQMDRKDVQLVIAGGSMYAAEYERTLKAMASPGVVFTGPADSELLAELYHHALLFILPSTLEGMSIALLEALQHGLPCLVSDIPENTAVIEHPLGQFRSADSASLAAQLTLLLNTENAYNELREYCRRRATEFTWERVVTNTLALYQQMCGSTATGSRPAAPVVERITPTALPHATSSAVAFNRV